MGWEEDGRRECPWFSVTSPVSFESAPLKPIEVHSLNGNGSGLGEGYLRCLGGKGLGVGTSACLSYSPSPWLCVKRGKPVSLPASPLICL